jgi:membrane protease subunit HflC
MKIKHQFLLFIIIVPLALILFCVYLSTYVVKETDQVIITRFGQVRGQPVTEAGLQWKMPFVDDVNRIERRYLPWDGPASEMSTKDKTYLIIDTYARWRISDPQTYFLRLRDERSALSRLDDILGSETRNAVAKYELIEIVRSDKNREVKSNQSLAQASESSGQSYAISTGRTKIQDEILEKAAGKLADFGIELRDLRFKRINYNETVRRRIYERMISERQQIASKFRSQGAGEAAKITGKKERDLLKLQSEAYRQVEEIHGEADANASAIYAKAYTQSPAAFSFYEFTKTLETYKKVLTSDVSLILTTDSPLFNLLNSFESGGESKKVDR